MKKFVLILTLLALTMNCSLATEEIFNAQQTIKVISFTEDAKWGLKDENSNQVIVEPIYKKMIRLEDSSWIVQNKRNKFGLIDNSGNILVPIKYTHADRIVSKFAKFGKSNKFGVYNSHGQIIIPHEYSKIDILYGKMFLTYKNYKYGLIGYDGEIILDNEFDDIYMPKPNVMRLKYKGEWYELEQVNAETLSLPKNAKENIDQRKDISVQNIVVNTGVISGYSVLTFSDYVLKIISSISPAHEETIDELLLSQGAETVSLFMKLSWLPKYPITYVRKYYENIRNPYNGPLSDVRNELKKQLK